MQGDVRSLTQTAGRAARHVNGHVIFYANVVTQSMQATMDETARRRAKQLAYNEKNGIIPQSVKKAGVADIRADQYINNRTEYVKARETEALAAESCDIKYLNKEQLQNRIKQLRKQMENAVKETEFLKAAEIRDQILAAEKMLKEL